MISKSKDKVLPRRDCGLKRHLALINGECLSFLIEHDCYLHLNLAASEDIESLCS
ncbi:Uncharacterised protein [Yersinia pestis]|uniref:Transposase n=1 Tax=Yersinia pestis TaxID=632 RepID=A0AAX2HZ41_YERPE|nr:Uncharacterised protein [Yersinia pestis]